MAQRRAVVNAIRRQHAIVSVANDAKHRAAMVRLAQNPVKSVNQTTPAKKTAVAAPRGIRKPGRKSRVPSIREVCKEVDHRVDRTEADFERRWTPHPCMFFE
jgi:hypothetical protein